MVLLLPAPSFSGSLLVSNRVQGLAYSGEGGCYGGPGSHMMLVLLGEFARVGEHAVPTMDRLVTIFTDLRVGIPV